MEALSRLERKILGWIKDIPHLPIGARQWLGENIWWIVIVAVVVSVLSALVLISSLLSLVGSLATPVFSYYASPVFLGLVIVTTSTSLLFVVIETVLFGAAITPLKEKQKKGWVLLFAAWLVGILAVVVSAVLTLNVITLIGSLIFNGVWIALSGYILFELHGQFAHTEKSKGVKAKKAATSSQTKA